MVVFFLRNRLQSFHSENEKFVLTMHLTSWYIFLTILWRRKMIRNMTSALILMINIIVIDDNVILRCA